MVFDDFRPSPFVTIKNILSNKINIYLKRLRYEVTWLLDNYIFWGSSIFDLVNHLFGTRHIANFLTTSSRRSFLFPLRWQNRSICVVDISRPAGLAMRFHPNLRVLWQIYIYDNTDKFIIQIEKFFKVVK